MNPEQLTCRSQLGDLLAALQSMGEGLGDQHRRPTLPSQTGAGRDGSGRAQINISGPMGWDPDEAAHSHQCLLVA